MTTNFPLLVKVLNDPLIIKVFDESQWSLMVRQARHSMLLAYLYYNFEREGVLKTVPDTVLKHLLSAKVHADKQLNDLKWEVKHIKKIAKQLGFPIVLLKGGSYAITEHLASKGRIFSDIDLLVNQQHINKVEKHLMMNGWVSGNLDEYDQFYYRQWMHEIPPLIHMFRRSVIDLHHNILPKTTKACPDASQLIKCAVKISGEENILSLCDEDRVIHSATHLFYDGDLAHGLRDLMDLKALLNNANQDQFELIIVDRALFLGLQRPVFYAFRYLKLILNVSISDAVITQSAINGSPNRFVLKMMDFLFFRALMPNHQSCIDAWTGFSRWVLYMRSHWLRMPLYLLIPHLVRKTGFRLTGKESH